MCDTHSHNDMIQTTVMIAYVQDPIDGVRIAKCAEASNEPVIETNKQRKNNGHTTINNEQATKQSTNK